MLAEVVDTAASMTKQTWEGKGNEAVRFQAVDKGHRGMGAQKLLLT